MAANPQLLIYSSPTFSFSTDEFVFFVCEQDYSLCCVLLIK